MTQLTIKDFSQRIGALAGRSWHTVNEVILVGSQGKRDLNGKLDVLSDVDLMVFTSQPDDSPTIYSDLARLGNDVGILIHPLIISEHERTTKLNMAHYASVYRQGKVIFRRGSPTTDRDLCV